MPPKSHIHHIEEISPQPPLRPINQAEINHDPSQGRIGPVHTLSPRFNMDGLHDQTRNPNSLNLERLRNAMKADEGKDTTGNTGDESGPSNTSNTTATNSKVTKSSGEDAGWNGEDEEGEGEKDDPDESDSDFEIVEKPTILTPLDSPTEESAYQATSLLTNKMPPELVPSILDYAEYFPHQQIAKKEGEEGIGSNQARVYLTAQIPDFAAVEDDTAGKGGVGGGRKGRVRRLVFKISSRDQGWSSYPAQKGTYAGANSWVEVELWRKDESGEMKKFGEPQLLQRNRHAIGEWTEHEITWDWKEDELVEGDEDRWEQGHDGWERQGRKRNGAWVRELRGGDELRVVMRAVYAGWRCLVKKCEVDCYWAV